MSTTFKISITALLLNLVCPTQLVDTIAAGSCASKDNGYLGDLVVHIGTTFPAHINFR